MIVAFGMAGVWFGSTPNAAPPIAVASGVGVAVVVVGAVPPGVVVVGVVAAGGDD
jgi:hypothetical protein